MLSYVIKLFLSVFGIFSHILVQTWFVWHETWHTTLLVIYYRDENVKIENNSDMLEIKC